MSDHPHNLVETQLKELSALGLAVDALAVYSEHSGCEINSDDLMVIGLMIRERAMQASELLLKWEFPKLAIKESAVEAENGK